MIVHHVCASSTVSDLSAAILALARVDSYLSGAKLTHADTYLIDVEPRMHIQRT
jgi:hypothetical protein